MPSNDRTKAAQLVTLWLEGRITNYEFDDQWPWESDDPGVVDIGCELWTLFDDSPEALLSVSNMASEDVALLSRCLEFLKSDEHYVVVPREPQQLRQGMISKFLGLGHQCPEAMPLKIPANRRKWWPFLDESQWQKVSQR